MSTNETSINAMSKDAISPYGTRDDLQNTSLKNQISDKELPDGARKELIVMKEQMDRTVAGYDKKINDMLNERNNLLLENDTLHGKLSGISK